jgi:hypothetical protein
MDYILENKVYPSIWYMCKHLLRKISTHPLILNPPIISIENGKTVHIEKYRLHNGIFLEPQKLALSIFPQSYPTDSLALPRPSETGVSAFIDEEYEFTRGGQDKLTYLIGIKLHYNTLKILQTYKETNLAKVPITAPTSITQQFLQPVGEKILDLDINPALPILSEYCELIRLAILDSNNPVNIGEGVPGIFTVKYFNIKEGSWEKDKNIYFQEAELLVMVDLLVTKTWRNNMTPKIECFSIQTNI